MDSARPLHDVFAELAGSGSAGGDPGELLRAHGHPELPAELVAEAVISYAQTAPVEVAEHLAPFVAAHSAPGADQGAGAEPAWLDLLATAPAGAETDGPGPAFDTDPEPGLDFGAGAEPVAVPEFEPDVVVDEGFDLAADPADLDSALPEPEPVEAVEVVAAPDDAGDDEPDPDPLG